MVLFWNNKSRREALTDIASFYLSINNVVTKSNDIRVSPGYNACNFKYFDYNGCPELETIQYPTPVPWTGITFSVCDIYNQQNVPLGWFLGVKIKMKMKVVSQIKIE